MLDSVCEGDALVVVHLTRAVKIALVAVGAVVTAR
jgi:hypothetical protein